MEDLSEYAQLRADNIVRNENFLLGIGVGPKKKPVRVIKRKLPVEPQQPTRRSRRIFLGEEEEEEEKAAAAAASSSSYYCTNCRRYLSFNEGQNKKKAIGGHNSYCRSSNQGISAGRKNYYEMGQKDEDQIFHEDED